MKSRIFAFALVAGLALSQSACSTVDDYLGLGSTAASVGAAVTPITQTEVSAYADATLVATIAAKTTSFAAQNWQVLKLTHDNLVLLNSINDSIHSAWVDLHAAKLAGKSLSFTAINAAIDSYKTFQTEHALSAQPVSPSEVPSS